MRRPVNLTDAHLALLAGPLAVQVAAATARLAPLASRGWGVEFDAEGCLVFVLLEAQTELLRAAIAETRKAAVNATHPLTLASLQFKGEVIEMAEPDHAAREVVDRRTAQFGEALAVMGIDPAKARGIAHPGPARRLVLRVREVFDQTPGPGAGKPLASA
jgi:hypothetical protein